MMCDVDAIAAVVVMLFRVGPLVLASCRLEKGTI